MYGREELELKAMDAFALIGIDFYEKSEADKVMDTMERRISRLTALVEALKKNSVALGDMYHKRLAQEQERIKELEVENSELKKAVSNG